jgi:bacillithiol system protein YtxJ
MRTLSTEQEVDELFGKPLVIVYKHSTRCSVSSLAHREMEMFAAGHPDHEVFKIDVIEDRSVSDYVEERTGIPHQSPQLLVLRDGEVVWSTSHFGVTARALVEELS